MWVAYGRGGEARKGRGERGSVYGREITVHGSEEGRITASAYGRGQGRVAMVGGEKISIKLIELIGLTS